MEVLCVLIASFSISLNRYRTEIVDLTRFPAIIMAESMRQVPQDAKARLKLINSSQNLDNFTTLNVHYMYNNNIEFSNSLRP